MGDAPVDAAAADRATALGGVVVAPSELVTAGPWIAGYRLVNRLSGTPDPATLEVELVRQDHDPRLLDAGFWTWDAASNAVVLSSVWPTGSLVVASYVPMTP